MAPVLEEVALHEARGEEGLNIRSRG
jgi:hypothetical protein